MFTKSILRKYWKCFLLSLLLTGLFACSDKITGSDNGVNGCDFNNLTAALENAADRYGFPGLAVGVVKNGEIAYAKGFGYANYETKELVTPHTVFYTASISKTFTSTAIMQLSEQKKLDIESRATEYLSYFEMNDARFDQITLKQMLTHTSGIPDIQYFDFDNPKYDCGALERYVRSLSSVQLEGAPGANWIYSSAAYNVLGDVVAKVSGLSFEAYMQLYVLQPAGMYSSTFFKAPGTPGTWAFPHLTNLSPRVWDGYPYNRAYGPASNLCSSVIDLCRWAIINLNQGTNIFGKILEPSTYAVLLENYADIQYGRGLFHTGGHQGLGWTIGNYRGEEIYGHAGSHIGFVSMIILIPDRSMAVTLLVNLNYYFAWDVTSIVLDEILDLEPQQFTPPAAVKVFRTLDVLGLEAAVAQWFSLTNDHPTEYDFGPGYFITVGGEILERGTDREADLFARLIIETMTQEDIDMMLGLLIEYMNENPGNPRAQIIYDILSAD